MIFILAQFIWPTTFDGGLSVSLEAFYQCVRRLAGLISCLRCCQCSRDLYLTCQDGQTVRQGRVMGLGHNFSQARETMAGETLEAAEIVRVMGDALPKVMVHGVVGPDNFSLLRALVEVENVDLPSYGKAETPLFDKHQRSVCSD